MQALSRRRSGGAMPDKANNPLPEAPDLNETASAIARGRELVKQAQRLREEAGRQIEEVQATIEQSDRILDRSHQLLVTRRASSAPCDARYGPAPSQH